MSGIVTLSLKLSIDLFYWIFYKLPSLFKVFNERGMFLRRVCIRFVKIVAGLATTSDGSVVIVDSVIPTIFVIDPENGKALRYLECAEFMIEPSDIAVFKDDFYICDFKVSF